MKFIIIAILLSSCAKPNQIQGSNTTADIAPACQVIDNCKSDSEPNCQSKTYSLGDPTINQTLFNGKSCLEIRKEI